MASERAREVFLEALQHDHLFIGGPGSHVDLVLDAVFVVMLREKIDALTNDQLDRLGNLHGDSSCINRPHCDECQAAFRKALMSYLGGVTTAQSGAETGAAPR